jgi:hypothetical protein
LIYMKILSLLVLSVHLLEAKADLPQLSEKEAAEVRQRLEAYDNGRVSFDEISGSENVVNLARLTNMTLYFRMRSNDVTIKMLLPISRSFVIVGGYSAASQLAKQYLNVYSNDCRGWYVLWAANERAEAYNEALEAGTNAIKFGCERNLAVTGADALRIGRVDVVEKLLVPRMLARKDSEPDASSRREIITFLVYYSVNSTNEALYLKALRSVKPGDVRESADLLRCVRAGCELFKSRETEQLCRQLIKN